MKINWKIVARKSVFGERGESIRKSTQTAGPEHNARPPISWHSIFDSIVHVGFLFFTNRFTRAPFNFNFANRPQRIVSKWTVMRGRPEDLEEEAAAVEELVMPARIFPARPRNRARVYWSYPNHRNFV